MDTFEKTLCILSLKKGVDVVREMVALQHGGCSDLDLSLPRHYDKAKVLVSPWVEIGKKELSNACAFLLKWAVGWGHRGWGPLSSLLLPQDVADFEWMMWFTSFRNVIIFTLSGHVLFAKVCSMTVPQVSQGWVKSSGFTWHPLGRHGWDAAGQFGGGRAEGCHPSDGFPSQHRAVVYMLYGMLAVLGSMGLTYLMIILSHCLILYSVALAKQKWLCYVAGLCCLASIKLEPFSSWQVGAIPSLPSASHPSPWVYFLGCPQTPTPFPGPVAAP